MMLADKGYDGDDVRSSLLMHGILPVILPKANRREPIGCDFKAYKDRNRIERRTLTPRGGNLQWQVNSTEFKHRGTV
jgi:IS5 family transposase